LAQPPARGLAGWPTDFKSGCSRSGSHETATILVSHNVELRPSKRTYVVAFRVVVVGIAFQVERFLRAFSELPRSVSIAVIAWRKRSYFVMMHIKVKMFRRRDNSNSPGLISKPDLLSGFFAGAVLACVSKRGVYCAAGGRKIIRVNLPAISATSIAAPTC